MAAALPAYLKERVQTHTLRADGRLRNMRSTRSVRPAVEDAHTDPSLEQQFRYNNGGNTQLQVGLFVQNPTSIKEQKFYHKVKKNKIQLIPQKTEAWDCYFIINGIIRFLILTHHRVNSVSLVGSPPKDHYTIFSR